MHKKTIRLLQDSIEADGPLTNLNTMKKLFTQRLQKYGIFSNDENNFFIIYAKILCIKNKIFSKRPFRHLIFGIF